PRHWGPDGLGRSGSVCAAGRCGVGARGPDEAAVRSRGEPDATRALAVGVAGGGVTGEAVQRPLASLELERAVRPLDNAEDVGIQAAREGGAFDCERWPRFCEGSVARRAPAGVVGEAVEGEALC